ncbi:MAG: hypothetical protein M3Y86_09225, partial [Verrucomicrobiota bacterium]|nr:hypothetical protein [Verrucomicrobiota bacterium]
MNSAKKRQRASGDPRGSSTPPASRFGPIIRSRRFRVGAILAVGLAAQGGCLYSTFYLDDAWQIQNSEYVEGGRW